jgi:hypothetical protein
MVRTWTLPLKLKLTLLRSLLLPSEKKQYINAVKCLASKPAKTPAGLAAGAKNRYDDFVATHINQTISIHGTVCSLCYEMRKRLTKQRETSWPGTDTSPGLTSKPCAMSAVTRATSHTTTGRNGPIIRPSRRPWMARIQACLGMESTSPVATTLVFHHPISVA